MSKILYGKQLKSSSLISVLRSNSSKQSLVSLEDPKVGLMSFREDLPYKTNSRYSKNDIKLFNKYRKEYLDVVKIMKIIFSRAQTVVNLELCNSAILKLEGAEEPLKKFNEQYANSFQRCLMEIMLDPETSCSRRLEPLNGGYITRSGDLITAFYIPEDIEWFSVVLGVGMGKIVVNYKQKTCYDQDSNNLELILERSKIIPSEEQNALENILSRSKNPWVRSDNCGEETINIDGLCYKRVVLFHPVLPVISLPFTSIRYEIPYNGTIYSEAFVTTGFIRNKIVTLKRGDGFTISFSDNVTYEYINNDGDLVSIPHSTGLIHCTKIGIASLIRQAHSNGLENFKRT